MSSDLSSICKALKTPPEPTTCWGKLAARWVDLKVWWTMNVWDRWAPDWLRHLYWPIERFYYAQISTRLWPRQRWLTQQVNRGWQDKNHLIEDLLYACAVHFVSPDGEDALNRVHWEAEEEAMLREIYAWATAGRAAHQRTIDAAYPPHRDLQWKDIGGGLCELVKPADLPSYEVRYGEVNRLEAELEEKDTRYLTWLVINRQRLWT